MDKIIIFGVYEFVGFHLCKGLLEQGYYVQGIHIDARQDGFPEEKRLEVGRNANFEEQSLKQWQEQKDRGEESITIILPLYDWYMTFSEAVVEQEILASRLFQDMQSRRNQKDKVVFLLPIQLLTDLDDREGLKIMDKMVEQSREMVPNVQLIFLPTIYGPWQPPEFLFQKELLKRLNEKETQTESVSREWRGDAIFIDDALDSLINSIEENTPGKFILESGRENNWKTCVDILQMDHSFGGEHDHQTILSVSEQLERIIADHSTSAVEGLLIQMNHLSRLSRFNGQ